MIFFIQIQTQSNLTEIRSYFYLHGQSNIKLMKTLWQRGVASAPSRRIPSPEWKCLNSLLWIRNHVDAKPEIFFSSGEVTRAIPLLYREYCIWDGNLNTCSVAKIRARVNPDTCQIRVDVEIF